MKIFELEDQFKNSIDPKYKDDYTNEEDLRIIDKLSNANEQKKIRQPQKFRCNQKIKTT